MCAELLLCLRCIKPRINVSKTTANNSNNSNWLLFGLITRQSSKRSSQNNNNNKTHKNYYEKPTKNQSTAFWHWQWTVPNYREKREREVGKRRGRDSRQAQQRGGPIVLGPQNVHRWITHFQILLPCVLCAVRVSAGYIHFESKASCAHWWRMRQTHTHTRTVVLLTIYFEFH